jgi:predicted DNA-binding protein YlxM (UPF0122 family)
MIFIGYDSEEAVEKEKAYIKFIEDAKEKWKQVIYDGELYPYEVSTKGRVRIKKSKKIRTQPKYKPYVKIQLTHPITGQRRETTVHRLMALAFLPIPQRYIDDGLTEKDLTVNHIDGIKSHNAIYNLEWATYSENTRHAYANNLINYKEGEDSYQAIISNDQAKQICELIQLGYSNKEISKLTGISTIIIHSIKGRRSWQHLSKDYVFTRTVDTVPYTLTDETLHNLCKDIMKGTMTGKDIAKKYNVSKSYIAMVKHYKIRPEITKMYEFNKRKNLPKRQNDELLNKLCKDLQDGVPVKDIMAKYEVGMSFVSEVKHGKIRPDISKNYKFK